MKLSIIILNYNVRYFLEQCVLSVKNAIKEIDGEIIVVDNNSPDDSCQMMRTNFPEITLIANKENVGFSKANNQAVAIAKGEYVCILNPDTAVTENCFKNTLSYIETLKNVGALGTYLMDGTGSYLPESKRNLPTPVISLKKMLRIQNNRTGYYVTNLRNDARGKAPVLVGAFMLLKRAIYLQVGGFDEDYFMYGEDIDLSYKLQQAGYTNYYIGDVHTLHYKGESTSKDKVYLQRFYGAMQIFYKKHFNHNVFIRWGVQLGVFIAKRLATVSKYKNTSKGVRYTEAYLVTENKQLKNKISKMFDGILLVNSIKVLKEKSKENTLVVFDMDHVSYNEALTYMRYTAHKNNVYRIKPSGCHFLLGSDQSDDKGSVIVF